MIFFRFIKHWRKLVEIDNLKLKLETRRLQIVINQYFNHS